MGRRKYLNTDLVGVGIDYQKEVLNDLESEMNRYLKKDDNIDGVNTDIRKDCLEWSLTGTIQNESKKYKRLISNTMNDKNSSTLREQVTVDLLDDYKEIPGKHFYDAYNYFTKSFGEIKPINANTKLTGSGGITDFASEANLKRLIKDHYLWSSNRLNMIISGFVKGRIVYIIEFPYGFKKFSQKLIDYGYDRFEGKTKEDVKNGNSRQGKSTRVFNFNYNDYIDCPDIKLRWVSPELNSFRKNIVSKFYNFLESNR
jgi:hypothetical protein